jgi:hypothetical protein
LRHLDPTRDDADLGSSDTIPLGPSDDEPRRDTSDLPAGEPDAVASEGEEPIDDILAEALGPRRDMIATPSLSLTPRPWTPRDPTLEKRLADRAAIRSERLDNREARFDGSAAARAEDGEGTPARAEDGDGGSEPAVAR